MMKRNKGFKALQRVTSLVLLMFALVVGSVVMACGTDAASDDESSSAAPAAASESMESQGPPGVQIVSTDAVYTIDDFANATNFKKSKEYDVEGLEGATAAIYGFHGPDPYDRQEFEIRFYPDHETAITVGVDYANESTGPDAVIAKDIQRWDEGLTQRRACQGNVRGSHHSGKCDNAKYGDYVVAGNVIVMCQGKDSETSLANCEALMADVQ